MRTKLCLALFACAALAPLSVHAWGPAGHQTVGAIADELLKGTAAEAQVRLILGDISLRQASVWADCAKGVTSSDDVTFIYRSNDVSFPECIPFGGAQWKAAFESFVSRNWKQCGTAHDSQMCHHEYHYADISNRRDGYDVNKVGANDHDIVHSVNAAVEVLRDNPAPSPFNIGDKKEALLLLSHYVGDIHQPLHVEAIYLSKKGKTVDPDSTGFSASNDTTGGNSILDGSEKFHHEWDAIPANLAVDGTDFDNLVASARTIATPAVPLSTWSTQWATETIQVGHAAFTGLRFAPKTTHASKPLWTVIGTHAGTYQSRADALKAKQLAESGARLAQVLQAIWPDSP
jgi:S1/P1 Nuclease